MEGLRVVNRGDPGFRPFRDFTYPRLCGELSAGGIWERGVATFRVEEIPLYPFAGEGEHAALWVEKRGRTTRDVAVGVARRLGLRPRDVGYAGMKDKACVAVQGFTVLGADPGAAREAFEAEGCRVLQATRHRNKLRLGHLAGNRFRVLLRESDPAAAEQVLERLGASGAPNYYGPQRFGLRGDNAAAGLAVLRGELRPGRWKRDLMVSALQAFVFNEVLARRVEAGTLAEALAGDVLRREDSGGLFVCTDPGEDSPRVERFEVSPTGPMPGRKMVRPGGAVAEAEAAVLRDLGIEEGLFRTETGTRRPLRVPVQGWRVEAEGSGVWVEFACPAGAFATSVVREITGRD